MSTDSPGTVLASYEYTIGANNERLTCTELNRTVEYEYDELERLVSETVTTGDTVFVTTYTYDANSNRVSMDKDGEVTTYEYNELNQLVRAGDVEYTWDNAGNLVSQTTTSGVIVATYTYDSYNRMVTASVNSNNGTLEQSYTYDYLGNRTSKTTDGVTTYYVTDLSSGYSQVLKATTGSDVIYYTRGFELISRNEGTEASYYLYDGGMSVRGITDEAGTLTDTYVFDAFGNEVARTGTTENSYGFQGEEKDETGLYYLRARYMDPSSGTFTTMDTYQGNRSEPMSLHKYLFASSNPVKNCDPSGHSDMVIESGLTVAILCMFATISLACIISVGMRCSKASVAISGSIAVRWNVFNVSKIATTLGIAATKRYIEESVSNICTAIKGVIAAAVTIAEKLGVYEVYLLHANKKYSAFVNDGASLTEEDLNNTILYVGRSKNYDKYRKEYHRKTKYFVDVDRPDIIPVPSYEASRTLEQGLMAYYHTKNAYNKVNGIAKSNTKYNKYAMAYGEAIIDYSTNQLEEEYLEMIEIGEILKDPTEWY